MITLEQIQEISLATPSKIVLLVLDGLGGLPHPKTGKTELETARTPNLDKLTKISTCGLLDPVSPGVTPGSAPGHLGLFGYDPVSCVIGRGVLEALGIDFPLRRQDVAARGNFCTIDESGRIVDRRAGRITTELCSELSGLLSQIKVKDVQIRILPVKEHRFVMILRGPGLSPAVSETDPQQTGVAAKIVEPLNKEAQQTADIINEFVNKSRMVLAGHQPANMILLRGFSQIPYIATMKELYKLDPAAIASYPMYRGLAKLVGMKVLDAGSSLEDEFTTLENNYSRHDFFFIHVKKTDSAGEDGDFDRKVQAIEEVDALMPRLIALKPDVIAFTGDHSTPAVLKGHSWHPVPVLLFSPVCRPDNITHFSERSCLGGGLGKFPARELIFHMMAHAQKFTKFGA
jgi:2,3-bisphosphoglycerate-independent phosphoglycerate mutase